MSATYDSEELARVLRRELKFPKILSQMICRGADEIVGGYSRPKSRPSGSNFALFDRATFKYFAVRMCTLTGFARWAKTVRTAKPDHVAFSLGELIGKPIEKTPGLLRLSSEGGR